MKKSDISIDSLRACCARLGYAFFEQGDFNLNIIGIRTEDPEANTFNDWLTLSYKMAGRWVLDVYPVTTDPGVYYRKHPLSVKGTAILVPGQYRGAYKLGMHRGTYPALVQRKVLPVYRDNNQDEILDYFTAVDSGYHGINIHRAALYHRSKRVDKWSAGCQVFADPENYRCFMGVCSEAKATWGPYFTYTLLTEDQLTTS